ncbi:hypothetical protein EON63_12515, partial [archaeon]
TMGLASSSEEITWEQPSEKHEATLYYFSGRGLADQIRWLLAATDVSFTQKVVAHRAQFERMAQRQLPFGQLPLLQIDGLEIVQSQAIVRYVARRAGIKGRVSYNYANVHIRIHTHTRTPLLHLHIHTNSYTHTNEGQSEEEVLKSDMLAECMKDMLSPLTSLPFKRPKGWTADGNNSSLGDGLDAYRHGMQGVLDKWVFFSARLEAVLKNNHRGEEGTAAIGLEVEDCVITDLAAYNGMPNMLFLVGRHASYVDILLAHLVTWMQEEVTAYNNNITAAAAACCSNTTSSTNSTNATSTPSTTASAPALLLLTLPPRPLLSRLTQQILRLHGLRIFLQSKRWFEIGDEVYADQVCVYVFSAADCS